MRLPLRRRPDSLCGRLLIALLLGAAALQGLNLYAVCFVQASYDEEVLKVSYEFCASVIAAVRSLEPESRPVFLKGLSGGPASQNRRFQLAVSEQPPDWETG
ncbi:MAG: hypothetical protein LBK52_06200, partial [Deltaproteobacteria bacterium]|nr:hypothetical protein [Deltaproteobacteria bacterium]